MGAFAVCECSLLFVEAVIDGSACQSTAELRQLTDRHQLITALHKRRNDRDCRVTGSIVKLMHQNHRAIFYLV